MAGTSEAALFAAAFLAAIAGTSVERPRTEWSGESRNARGRVRSAGECTGDALDTNRLRSRPGDISTGDIMDAADPEGPWSPDILEFNIAEEYPDGIDGTDGAD